MIPLIGYRERQNKMQPRKQHLIETALTLFNEKGYHATGIDLILAESKVSKATLYKHFRSKDELILAALQLQHEHVLGMIKGKITNASELGSSRVLALFDGLHAWFNSDRFYGCNFINASAEYADADDPIHVYAAEHKQAIVDLVRIELAPEDKSKADQIDLLVEGAIVMAHTRGIKDAALMAKEMARSLIK